MQVGLVAALFRCTADPLGHGNLTSQQCVYGPTSGLAVPRSTLRRWPGSLVSSDLRQPPERRGSRVHHGLHGNQARAFGTVRYVGFIRVLVIADEIRKQD